MVQLIICWSILLKVYWKVACQWRSSRLTWMDQMWTGNFLVTWKRKSLMTMALVSSTSDHATFMWYITASRVEWMQQAGKYLPFYQVFTISLKMLRQGKKIFKPQQAVPYLPVYKPHLFPRKIAPKAGVRLIYGNTWKNISLRYLICIFTATISNFYGKNLIAIDFWCFVGS